jgi:hypothetical protein
VIQPLVTSTPVQLPNSPTAQTTPQFRSQQRFSQKPLDWFHHLNSSMMPTHCAHFRLSNCCKNAKPASCRCLFKLVSITKLYHLDLVSLPRLSLSPTLLAMISPHSPLPFILLQQVSTDCCQGNVCCPCFLGSAHGESAALTSFLFIPSPSPDLHYLSCLSLAINSSWKPSTWLACPQ